jgi:hypothetical protein
MSLYVYVVGRCRGYKYRRGEPPNKLMAHIDNRRQLTLLEKKVIVDSSYCSSIRQAAIVYGVARSSIREWRKGFLQNPDANLSKLTFHQGPKLKRPHIENSLHIYYTALEDKNLSVKTHMLVRQAMMMSNGASKEEARRWVYRFMQR